MAWVGMPQLLTWTGLPKVREAFRQEGFGVPDAYVRLVAEFCGDISTEEFLEEDDRRTLAYLSDSDGRTYQPAGAMKTFQERARVADAEDLHTRIHRPLTIARFEELERAGENPDPPLRKATEIRAYAESFGKTNGFVLRRDNNAQIGFMKRAMTRIMPRTGLTGVFSVDAGGMSGFVLRSDGWPIYHASSTGLYFTITAGGADSPWLWCQSQNLLSGLGRYDVVDSVRGRRSFHDFSEPGDLDLVSKSASWGVKAQIRFFDLLLAQLDADL
jgi:hypothetical protein